MHSGALDLPRSVAGVVVAESGGLQTSAALASAIMQDASRWWREDWMMFEICVFEIQGVHFWNLEFFFFFYVQWRYSTGIFFCRVFQEGY